MMAWWIAQLLLRFSLCFDSVEMIPESGVIFAFACLASCLWILVYFSVFFWFFLCFLISFLACLHDWRRYLVSSSLLFVLCTAWMFVCMFYGS